MVRELNTKGIKTLSNDLGLPTKKIYDFLFYLKQAVSIDNRLLVRKLGVSKNVLNQIKKHMADFLKPVSDQTALNPKGIDLANQILEKSYQAEESIWQNLKGNKNSENIIRILEKYDSARPQPDRNWDQFTATVATTAKRVTLMDFFQDIQEKKVLCLGDDDLVSVAVANLKKSAQVSVLDIDKQLLDAIETISKKENIQVITQAYDARQSLPRNFMGKFDVVLSCFYPERFRLWIRRITPEESICATATATGPKSDSYQYTRY
jgi:predicted methyltransferase